METFRRYCVEQYAEEKEQSKDRQSHENTVNKKGVSEENRNDKELTTKPMILEVQMTKQLDDKQEVLPIDLTETGNEEDVVNKVPLNYREKEHGKMETITKNPMLNETAK